MDAQRLLLGQLEAGNWTLTEAAKDLTDLEFFQHLPHGGESPAWIFGHLATNEDWFLSKLTGSSLALPNSMRDAFQADFPQPTRRPHKASKDLLIKCFREQRNRVIRAVKASNTDRWNDAAPEEFPAVFKTAGDVWGALGTHQYWHIGQLMSIRSMLGRPPFQFPPHKSDLPASNSTDVSGSTHLVVPIDGPRIRPREPGEVNAYVRAEFDKAMETWGIHNNLARTMGCHPLLALTEVDYANSFIFKKNEFVEIPRPGKKVNGESVLFPAGGFIDRVTKELVICLVSLLNRSRYSITHHSVISFGTLSSQVEGGTPQARAARAEAMLLNLVDASGMPMYRYAPPFKGKPLYTPMQIEAMSIAERCNRNPHAITDEEFDNLRKLLREEAKRQIAAGPLASQFERGGPDSAYLDAYEDGMLVELTWCIAHFSGLLNRWFTLLKMRDEQFAVNDQGQSFTEVYDTVVPDSIKVRNNGLLGASGWGE